MRAWRFWAAAHNYLVRAAAFFDQTQAMGFSRNQGNQNQHSVHEEVPNVDKASE
jgi:hypothetical protein